MSIMKKINKCPIFWMKLLTQIAISALWGSVGWGGGKRYVNIIFYNILNHQYHDRFSHSADPAPISRIYRWLLLWGHQTHKSIKLVFLARDRDPTNTDNNYKVLTTTFDWFCHTHVGWTWSKCHQAGKCCQEWDQAGWWWWWWQS